MSLLWMEYEAEFEHLVDAAFEKECSENPEYFNRLSPRVRKIIYRDTRYNVDYLYTAYVLNEKKIINSYGVWLYQLMAGILSELTPEEVKDYVIRHLEAIRQSIPQVVSQEKIQALQYLLEEAQKSIREYQVNDKRIDKKASGYENEIAEYMNLLKKRNTKDAIQLIMKFINQGISLDDIYVEILSESMRRVGELWHNAEITVDTEHYCTSVT